MTRGTTPTLVFTLPFAASELAAYYITAGQQFGSAVKQVFEKSAEDCQEDGDTITVVLTQDDTLKLVADNQVLIQVRARTTGGTALASKIFRRPADMILKDGVI